MDHLPMAAPGQTHLDRFWTNLQTYAVFENAAADAEDEADRAYDRAKEARMRADDAKHEFDRAKAALTPEEWADAKNKLSSMIGSP